MTLQAGDMLLLPHRVCRVIKVKPDAVSVEDIEGMAPGHVGTIDVHMAEVARNAYLAVRS